MARYLVTGSMKRATLLLGLALTTLGCEDPTTEPEVLESLEITPEVVRLDALGLTTRLEVIGLSGSGVEMPDTEVDWSSSNSSVATVSSAGVVTAVGPGTATITASTEEALTTARVIVEQTIHSVTASLDSVSLNYIGAGRALQANAVDARGNPVQGAALTWRSTAPDTVSVSASGQITALRLGTALIIAEAASGAADTVRVRVRQVAASVQVGATQTTIQVGQTTQLSAVVRDSANNIIAGAPVTWSSGSPTTASVNSTTGLVTGVAAGSATITATSGAASGSVGITVQLSALGSVQLNPDSAVVGLDSTQSFTVTLRDASGNIVSPDGRSITWTSSAPSIATVTGTGASAVVTGVAEGIANIIVSSGGRADTARVRVVVPCVAGTIALGQTVAGALATTDCTSGGRYFDRWTMTITTDTVVRFDLASGAFNPVLMLYGSGGTLLEQDDDDGPGTDARIDRRLAPGTYTLEVTSVATGGTGSYTLRAAFVPVASVDISPDSAVLQVGNSAQFVATLFDAGAAPISPSGRTFTWTSTAPSIASVAASGDTAVVTANAAGTASIIVSSGGRADTVLVRVTPTCGGGSISIGGSVSGSLATTDCEIGGKYYDRWTLTVPTQTHVRIDMTAGFDTYLVLTDQTGTVIEEDDDDGDGTNSRIERVLAAGTYYIRTTSFGAGATGAYTLSVSTVSSDLAIGTARQQPAGTSVTIVGVVTAASGTFTDHSFYMQDATGGIGVRLAAGSTSGTWAEGDSVRLSGTIGSFNQEVELTGAVTVTTLGTTSVPAPVTVSSTQLKEGQRQGELLRITGAAVDSLGGTNASGYRVHLTDASGAFVVQVDSLTGIPGSTFQAGATYTITGIAGRSGATFYLQPRRSGDVVVTSSSDPCSAWNSQTIAIGQTRSGTLAATDCAPGDGYYYEGYRLTIAAETSIDVVLASTQFDAFLILTDTGITDPGNTANWLASNNDDPTGGTPNSRMTGTIAPGEYILWASSNGGGETGAYQLSVN